MQDIATFVIYVSPTIGVIEAGPPLPEEWDDKDLCEGDFNRDLPDPGPVVVLGLAAIIGFVVFMLSLGYTLAFEW